MKAKVERFLAETGDQSKWTAPDWSFAPGDLVWTGHLELEGLSIGPISCGWPRPDALASFPSDCPTENVGFRTHVFLTPDLQPGEHQLDLVFCNDRGQELRRIDNSFCTKREIAQATGANQSPAVNTGHSQSAYLDLLEKTLTCGAFVSLMIMVPFKRADKRRGTIERFVVSKSICL